MVALNKFKVLVKTGGQEKAGTDANVFVALEDEEGVQTPKLKLDNIFYDDLERGSLDSYYSQPIPETFGSVKKLILWRDKKGNFDDWFCDYIIIQDSRGIQNGTHRKIKNLRVPGIITRAYNNFPAEIYFPICRWIRAEHKYVFHEFGAYLPEDDPTKDVRWYDLEMKKKTYRYVVNSEGLPAQCAELPSDEKFSDEYFWTFLTEKAKLLAKTTFLKWTTRKWKSISELKSVYKKSLGEPECLQTWDTDKWFALQRLQGLNPMLITHCKKIPENFDVTEETVAGLIDETLREALEKNKIFICDLAMLDGIHCKESRKLAAPLALFYLKGPQELIPVAIQLQQKKGKDNPVFTPKDQPNTWLVAKMFYNNAEAQHHQGVSHLGLTHLLMEGICVCTHRNLSPSHPMFKLMAPHFLFLLAINSRGLEKLIAPGGWVDFCMTIGVEGIYEVIRRGIKSHHFYNYGNVEQELKSRGVLDPKILPCYPYRDDSVSLFKLIRNYAEAVVRNHYDTQKKLEEDWELKEWRLELSLDKERGGVGLVGVPGDDVKGFTQVEELVETVSIIIATCSMGHAAANFQQYSQYAFVPNYAGILMIDPPTTKRDYSEAEILEILPDMSITLDTMVITKLLSSRGTKSLGDFEMQYLYHPDDVAAADEFRKELKKLSLEIQKRNLDRKVPFDWLNPEIVPNAISI